MGLKAAVRRHQCGHSSYVQRFDYPEVSCADLTAVGHISADLRFHVRSWSSRLGDDADGVEAALVRWGMWTCNSIASLPALHCSPTVSDISVEL